MRAVVFDLDGTLIDSAPDIHASINLMLADFGYDALDLETVTSFIGNGLPKLVERTMKHHSIDLAYHAEMTQAALAHYKANTSGLTKLYDGVLPALKTLRQGGHRLGLCTNKPHGPAISVLREFKMIPLFDYVIGGDSLSTRKPNPEMLFTVINALGAERVLYVGDSEVDYETAQNAGVPFALFTQGYRKHSLDYFESALCFDRFENLPDLVQNLDQAAR